jgi:3-deoxy-manno-octulosonate cytidylyltransferase (CMP-KDO synthetase)
MTLIYKVVIPARYASTRLPGKPLIKIDGKPMIAHVCERAKEAGASEIIVATDDDRIFQAVRELGFDVVITAEHHQSGTERIAEVAGLLGWSNHEIIVNLQGDEPLIPPEYIREVAYALAGQQLAGIATLAARIEESEEIFNPNSVKVVLNKDGYALYFSRAPIPWDRAGFGVSGGKPSGSHTYLRHIGMYAYTVDFLNRYCAWQNSALESIEALEQLRILWQGESILVKMVDKTPVAGVDTIEDFHRVESLMRTGFTRSA